MKLQMALAVAKQMCNKDHPATIRSKQVSPNLLMILVNNGQFLTSSNLERARHSWTFEEFVQEFGGQK